MESLYSRYCTKRGGSQIHLAGSLTKAIAREVFQTHIKSVKTL